MALPFSIKARSLTDSFKDIPPFFPLLCDLGELTLFGPKFQKLIPSPTKNPGYARVMHALSRVQSIKQWMGFLHVSNKLWIGLLWWQLCFDDSSRRVSYFFNSMETSYTNFICLSNKQMPIKCSYCFFSYPIKHLKLKQIRQPVYSKLLHIRRPFVSNVEKPPHLTHHKLMSHVSFKDKKKKQYLILVWPNRKNT